MGTADTIDSSKPAAESIDLSRYKSSELADSIKDLLGLKEKVTTGLRITGAVFILLSIIPAIWLHDEAPLALTLGILFASLPSFTTGLTLSMLTILKGAGRDILRVLDLSLDLTGKIQQDLLNENIDISPLVIFQAVIHNLVHPTVETLIENQLGFFGKPVAFIYGKSFKLLDKHVTKVIEEKQAKQDKEAATDKTEEVIQENKSSLAAKLGGKITEKIANVIPTDKASQAIGKVKEGFNAQLIAQKVSDATELLKEVREPVALGVKHLTKILSVPLYLFCGLGIFGYVVVAGVTMYFYK